MQFAMALISAVSLSAATALFAPTSAIAQAAPAAATPNVVAGAMVSDTAGAPVGTVVRVDGGNAVVKTDRHEVGVAVTSFGKGKDGLVLAMTQAELNATAEQALAAAQASITVGATVRDPQGGTVGTIEAMEAELVTIALPSGAKARLPKTALAGTPNGPVIGVTAAQLEAQVAGATGQ